jgi:hypothetical protein
MSKIVTLAVAAAAYVLGAKAGRQRYEKIRTGAERIWSDPRVRNKTQRAAETVRGRAPQVKERLTDAVKQTAEKVSSRNSGTPDPMANDLGPGSRDVGPIADDLGPRTGP